MSKGGRPPGPDGVAVVDKPAGWTSHDVVARSRGLLGTRKVGHSGTLDPDATGVLVLGVGRATRLLRYLTALGKSYEAEVVLGTETSTLDAAGEVTATHDMAAVTLDDARRVAAEQLTGPILQVPPMVSAVKVDGRRLHELAREGIEVAREARPVTVHTFTLDEGPEPGVLRAAVACSSGTYVRTLAADLGHALGGGAHLRALRRTSVGGFTLADAVALDALTPEDLLPVAAAVAHLPSVVVDGDVAVAVGHGKVLDRPVLGVDGGEGPWAVLDPSGALLAVYADHRGGTVKPDLVIPAG
ncbi:tRNA pseudouridine(55) synthase TruB [Iamia majanohamensis]|uniref:tRNA pseudouridine synthase B n=1 Tax=Iamia majanohamensis TaxID=467976 RepID=A0AAF0BQV1_9ACTN|nr:tRNA pseudouridine(55) synthase TruB [Iamia majanohamensis]WCO65406.1 tRNA pseudouridine(55) synthase TruB [Iamia majanohamensis]